MGFKFENLEVWQLAVEYVDRIYDISNLLPDKERHNLKSQMIRAATSVSLNIAEGSTGQTDLEFNRFLGIAIRSCVEVIACLHLAKRRGYVDEKAFSQAYEFGEKLFAKLQALRKKLK
ncbi:MAG: four helix bundle protein [Candidatus Zixiibacteriota bacterium]